MNNNDMLLDPDFRHEFFIIQDYPDFDRACLQASRLVLLHYGVNDSGVPMKVKRKEGFIYFIQLEFVGYKCCAIETKPDHLYSWVSFVEESVEE